MLLFTVDICRNDREGSFFSKPWNATNKRFIEMERLYMVSSGRRSNSLKLVLDKFGTECRFLETWDLLFSLSARTFVCLNPQLVQVVTGNSKSCLQSLYEDDLATVFLKRLAVSLQLLGPRLALSCGLWCGALWWDLIYSLCYYSACSVAPPLPLTHDHL